jgi:hypothetical protein
MTEDRETEPQEQQEEQEQARGFGPVERAERETAEIFTGDPGKEGTDEGMVDKWMAEHEVDTQDLFHAIGNDMESAVQLAASTGGMLRPDVLWLMGFVVGVTYQRNREAN